MPCSCEKSGLTKLMGESKTVQVLEPLVAGLRIYLDESPQVAKEIFEIGNDVAESIRDVARADGNSTWRVPTSCHNPATCTDFASPTNSRRRIAIQLISSSYHAKPWRADVGCA